MSTRTLTIAFAAIASIASAANAQYSMSWSTIDCGGGVATGTSPTNVVYTMTHVIGQPDAGPRMTGGTMKLDGGFLPVGIAVPPPCPTDLNHDGATNTIDLTRSWARSVSPGRTLRTSTATAR